VVGSSPGRFGPKKAPSGDVKRETGRAPELILEAFEKNKSRFEVLARRVLGIQV